MSQPTNDRPRRTNGLESPYTVTQMSTWVFLPSLVLEFLFFVSPLLPLAASVVCTCIFCGIAGASTFYGYVAMKIDPSDPRLFGNHHPQNNNSNNNNSNGGGGETAAAEPEEEDTKQCWICDVQVGAKSMHCKFCNKCVDGFDHHCMWLNTCVGKANYPYFFRTMICIALLLIVHTAVQLALVLDIFFGNGETKQRSEEWFGLNSSSGTIVVVTVMGFFLLFDICSLLLIGQLLAFHLKLQRQGLTTYSYIVQENRKRRQEDEQKRKVQRRRDEAIRKAEEDGNWWLSKRLSTGGYCRESCNMTCCDPLPSEDEENGNNGPSSAAANGQNGSNGITNNGTHGNGTSTTKNGTAINGQHSTATSSSER